VETRKPLKPVIDTWDKKYHNICIIIEQELKKVTNYREMNLNQLSKNIFVPSNLSKLAEYNLSQAEKKLKNLEITVEKIHHAYHSAK
jgi:hypothetical protein